MDQMFAQFQTIIKRNGQEANFDANKITKAILKAGQVTGEFDESIAMNLTFRVLAMAQTFFKETVPTVEQIQDIVEEVLLHSSYKKTAKAYIIYRDQHARIREISSSANHHLIEDYLNQSDWRVKENSNMSYSLQGLNNHISANVSQKYWLNRIYPAEIREAHESGDLHIHDLGQLSVYCVGWDLHDLLISGFKGVAGKVTAKPAQHFRTILGQVTNFFYTLQGEAAGAQAFSNFDTLLAPFIYYDQLTYRDVKQAIQEFLFNINVPTRVGFQTPFTNITMDLAVPTYFKDQAVVVGGELKEKKYGDFQQEMNWLNKAFLETMAEGDASGRVFTFPIPTYNISKNFDWDNKDLDILWKVTGKYGLPYFANFVNSDMNPEDARSMCCRLRIDNRELVKRGGGLFGSAPLTGSIGVVTINMPRLGYLAKDETDFLHRLEKQMILAKLSLEIKRKTIEQQTENGLYPYTKYYLRNTRQRFGKYWQNHFSTIGIIGMNEACLNLMDQDISRTKGKAFTEKVLDFMREQLSLYQEETGEIFNLEATPAEGASYRLALLDRERFPQMLSVGAEQLEFCKRPYYTNSTHQPVNQCDDLFGLLDQQDAFQTKYTGGTVLHLFIGERIEDTETVKNLVKTISNNYHLPYFSITPTFSVCPNCGYISGEQAVCLNCEAECEIYSRVVGYLRPVNQWNDGKQAEFEMRKVVNL